KKKKTLNLFNFLRKRGKKRAKGGENQGGEEGRKWRESGKKRGMEEGRWRGEVKVGERQGMRTCQRRMLSWQ
ncbi:MAG: hypothetical protein ILA04_06380, partial [Prevotella sp.]|nr:hypothetical protein [Prevotella sp.]